eukprot:1574345-Ditylum_brightwellii.AAC.1
MWNTCATFDWHAGGSSKQQQLLKHGCRIRGEDWQCRWSQLTAMLSKPYDVPKGPVGRWFIEVYTLLVDMCIKRKWNRRDSSSSQWLYCSRSREQTILTTSVTELNIALIYDGRLMSSTRRQMPANQHQETEAHVTKTFLNMLFQGKLCQAVCWLTGWEKRGLLSPNDRCTKSGEVVSEVLRSKHPEP